ncbi:unnamed protein product [Leptosia nina]|uniref:Uncharacterized protein n=1 Tax=Leptosia nina TaxID=320188 RepID=A0AAV1J1D6_9NEOP
MLAVRRDLRHPKLRENQKPKRLTKLENITTRGTTMIYRTTQANWQRFNEKIRQSLKAHKITEAAMNQIEDTSSLEATVARYIQLVQEACDSAIPKLKHIKKSSIPWWNAEIEQLKKELEKKKRAIRCARLARREYVIKEYTEAKNSYELTVETTRVESWKRFCGSQTREGMWNGIYRILSKAQDR